MDNQIINGYTLLGPLTNANAGYGRWGFAEKDGTEYFIKEFLNPIFPTKESPYPPEMQEKIKVGCQAYQKQKQRLYRAVNETSDGNLVRIEEFFRWGSKYYITTRRIRGLKMDLREFAKEPMQERLRVCCALSHALLQMHEKGIVHADVKADNIILERSVQGCITAKLIDVDCSFFEDTPPEDGDELGGDQNYFSPEGFLFKYLGPEEVKLTCKMDVFAMGVLIHQLLTGELPSFGSDYNYAFEACLDDQPVNISPELPKEIQYILSRMIRKEPEDRCTMQQAFYMLRHNLAPHVIWDVAAAKPAETPAPAASAAPQSGGRLRFGSFSKVGEAKAVYEQKTTDSTGTRPAAEDFSDGFFSKGGDL